MPTGVDRKELGRQGESLAATFLQEKGYRLLKRNWTLPLGEVDLVLQDGATLVLAEVKTYAAASAIDPVYKIGPAKQRKLWQLARLAAARYPDRNIRIDAVTVCCTGTPVIRHYENILFS